MKHTSISRKPKAGGPSPQNIATLIEDGEKQGKQFLDQWIARNAGPAT